MTRRYLTPRAKIVLWQQQDECCAECRERMAMSKLQWDHILSLGLCGSNEGANFQGLCVPCHARKSRLEAGMRAKADRQRQFHEGKKKRRGRAMQSRGFDKQLRRRMDGTVEVRNGQF